MGLFTNGGIDVLAISKEMRKSVRLWQTVYVLVMDPGVQMVNFRTKSPAAFVWSGRARYQPYRKDIAVPQVTDPTTTATARFQVDLQEDGQLPEIKTGYRVWIAPATLLGTQLALGEALWPEDDLFPGGESSTSSLAYPDPHISLYDHVVTSAMNSSLAWQRTIETIVNTEARPNYNIVSNGAGGWVWG